VYFDFEIEIDGRLIRTKKEKEKERVVSLTHERIDKEDILNKRILNVAISITTTNRPWIAILWMDVLLLNYNKVHRVI